MKRFFRIFFALASGILIGGMLTAKLADGYFWWLGALAGGTLVWIMVDSKAIIVAITPAFRNATARRPTKSMFVVIAHRLRIWCNVFLVLFTMWCAMLSFATLVYTYTLYPKAIDLEEYKSVYSISVFIVLIVSSVAFPIFSTNNKQELLRSADKFQRDAWEWNIVSLLVYQIPRFLFLVALGVVVLLIASPYLISYAAALFFRAVGKVPFFLAKFTYELYKLAHTEERTICFVDAALGVGITYLLGSSFTTILTIAILGGIFGYFNVKVVKEQWLPRVDAKVQQFFQTMLAPAQATE